MSVWCKKVRQQPFYLGFDLTILDIMKAQSWTEKPGQIPDPTVFMVVLL